MSDAALVRHLVQRRLVSPSDVERARALQSELRSAGLELGVDEVLVRLGRLDEAARRGVREAVGRGAPEGPSFPPQPVRDRRASALAVERGALSESDVVSVEAFVSWAAGRGLSLGLAEVLVRRGYLAASEVEGLLQDTGSRRSATRSIRAEGRTTGRSARTQERAAPWSKGLLIGLGAGGGLALVVLAGALLASGGGSEEAPVAVPPASKREAKEPETPPRPEDELETRLAEVERRLELALSDADLEAAERELERFEDLLGRERDRERHGERLAELARRVREVRVASRPVVPDPGPEPARPADPNAERRRRIDAIYEEVSIARRENRLGDAVQHVTRIVELEAAMEHYLVRAQIQLDLTNYYAVVEDCDLAERAYRPGRDNPKWHAEVFNVRAEAKSTLLDMEGARRDYGRWLELAWDDKGRGHAHYALGSVSYMEGDFEAALHELEESLRWGREFTWLMMLGMVRLEMGDRAAAVALFDEAGRDYPDPEHRAALAACRAWAAMFPLEGTVDAAAARRILDAEGPLGSRGLPIYFFVHAAVASWEGDHRKAHFFFSAKNEAWTSYPAMGFFYARSALARGFEEEANRVLRDAERLRPGLAERFGFQGEERRVLVEAREEAGELAAKETLEERRAVERERETRVLRLSQIQALERSYRFVEAARDYRAYAGQVESESIREEAEAAARRSETLAMVLDRLVEAARKRELEEIELPVGSSKGRIVGADGSEVELAMGAGSARVSWRFLALAEFCRLGARVRPAPGEWLALGGLALENGLEEAGFEALVKAHADEAQRSEIDRLVARRLGVEVPAGGFVLHKGKFATREEKAFLDQDLVRFRGEWVTREDRERLLGGYQKVKGQWTRLTEADLEARGYVRVGSEWLGPAELAERNRGSNDLPDEKRTPHFVLRTDRGPAFLEDLGQLLEAAWPVYGRMFGAEPSPGRPLVVLAFKDFEGYRAYCARLGAADVLAALGFAPSEEYTCCGYDKFGDARLFLQTLVHEAAHLYFHVTFGKEVPSWYAEAMATYFEGFEKEGGAYRFHVPSDRRLSTLTEVLDRGNFDLEKILAGDAQDLINRDSRLAVEFYAVSWGVYYFMSRSIDPAIRQLHTELLEAAKKGEPVDFVERLGRDRLPEFEKAFVKFVRQL